MQILYVALFIYLFTLFMWPAYLAVMNIERNRGKLTPVAKFPAYPVVIGGVLMDVGYNITVGTIIFLDLPREWLMTTRLDRYLARGKTGWRLELAKWFCRNLLDPFDPAGRHCG